MTKKKIMPGTKTGQLAQASWEETKPVSSIIHSLLDDTTEMINVTVDFESYYSAECTIVGNSNAEYVAHPDFHVIGVGLQLNDSEPRWFHGDKVEAALNKIPWHRARMIAHNCPFDATILSLVYGHYPKEYYCTAMGARPHIVPFSQSQSLGNVSKYLKLDVTKGDYATTQAKGKRYADFTADELEAYGAYCKDDVRLSYWIYKEEIRGLDDDEQLMIHLTTAKAIQPQLCVDRDILQLAYDAEVQRKKGMLKRSGIKLETVMSNVKFAAALRNLGVEPPMKISPRTNKETYAFAKNDLDFTALLNHHHADVRALVEVRIGAKSTIEESRLSRFLRVTYIYKGMLIFPLMYFGAHTGRASGSDKLNLQNLTNGSALREAIRAPEGYKLVVSDLSQIEARMVAWFCQQLDLLADFADTTIDVYCKFGTSLEMWGEVTKETKDTRFIAKQGVLSLMYASGHVKFEHTVNSSTHSDATITTQEAKQIVDSYRSKYSNIKRAWSELNSLLIGMCSGCTNEYRGLRFVGRTEDECARIELPEGRVIYYPELYRDAGGEMFYLSNKKNQWKKIYGGACLENVIQALAQIVIRNTELRVARKTNFKYTAAGQVHDELIYVAPDAQAEQFSKYLSLEMCVPPQWCSDVPLECETSVAENYASCK